MNNIRQQRGVALVQVLLITAMLLILTIELSKDSRSQIKTAIALKQKAQLVLQAHSLKEQLKYDLMVSVKDNTSGVKEADYRFDSTPVKQGNLTFTVQDEDGLVSSMYGGQYLDKLLGESSAKLITEYQGGGNLTVLTPEMRGGIVPSLKELRMVDSGNKAIKSAEMTQLPTLQFNLYNSPNGLLERLFGAEQAQQIIALKQAGNANHQSWQEITGRDSEYDVSFLPGNFLVLTITAKHDDLEIVRKTRLMMNFDIQPFMAEIVAE